MKCYRYLVKFSSEEREECFHNIKALVDYLNNRIGLEGYTQDMLQNYFIRKGRKINPLIGGLYHLSRQRADKAI